MSMLSREDAKVEKSVIEEAGALLADAVLPEKLEKNETSKF